MTLQNGDLTITQAAGRLKAAADDVTLKNIAFNGDGQAHVFTGADANYTGWRFKNCTFDGVSLRLTKLGRTQADGSTAETGTGVTDGSVIEECEFFGYHPNYTIELAGVDDVQVASCHIHDFGTDIDTGDGIKVNCGATNILISGCTIEDGTRDGIDTFDAGTVVGPITMQNNTILRCGALGIDSKNDTEQVANAPEGDIIIGNTIADCGNGINGGGINSTKPYSTIQDNTVTNCGQFGIRVDGVGTPMNVSGNVCSENIHDIRIGVNLQATITDDEKVFVRDHNTYTTQSGLL